MSGSDRHFDVSINRLYPGEKLGFGGGERRWARFNAGFSAESHTADSLLAEIMRGYAFCCVLGGCDLDHCGVRWCCADRKSDPRHCGRPVGYRKGSHFQSAQSLELDFDQGDETSSIPHLLTDPFFCKYAAFLYSTLSSTPDSPKSRVVFILEGPYTDAEGYRQARIALLHRYPRSDPSIKDAARFLYGSHPHTGEAVLL